jgi:hypothetical protein
MPPLISSREMSLCFVDPRGSLGRQDWRRASRLAYLLVELPLVESKKPTNTSWCAVVSEVDLPAHPDLSQ